MRTNSAHEDIDDLTRGPLLIGARGHDLGLQNLVYQLLSQVFQRKLRRW